MELLTHDGEHHEIGDGGWLMMTTATDPPLRSPERTPDQLLGILLLGVNLPGQAGLTSSVVEYVKIP